MHENRKKAAIPAIAALFGIIIVSFWYISFEGGHADEKQENNQTLIATPETESTEKLSLSFTLEDYYTTNTGNPTNLYHIDENNVLWGCGDNHYGQLGQGTQDNDFHEEMVKIAENVVHVDYSEKGFVIYLTADKKLYGFGNAGSGALQQYDEITPAMYRNAEKTYTIQEPILLLEDVVYAKCGQDDIAALKTDKSVWVWGNIWRTGDVSCYSKMPVKVLEDAIFLTGGWFNHAALQSDGSVWTWGYNYTGNCGVSDGITVSTPVKVADDVIMVWTESTKYNTDCKNIADFQGEYERSLENTMIQKSDGSYWICGKDVGETEKILSDYFEAMEYRVICSSEFLPWEGIEKGACESPFSP